MVASTDMDGRLADAIDAAQPSIDDGLAIAKPIYIPCRSIANRGAITVSISAVSISAVLSRLRRFTGGSAANARVSVLAVLRLCWRASPRLLLVVLVLVVLLSSAAPVTLLLVQALVDAFAAGRTAAATPIIAGLAAVTVARGAVQALIDAKQTELGSRVGYAAEVQLLDVAGQAPLVKYYDSGWFDQVARARDGVEWRPPQAMSMVMMLFGTLVTLGGMVAIVATLDAWMLVLAVLAAVPTLVNRRNEARALYRVRRGHTVLMRRRDYLFDVLLRPELAKDVRAYGLAPTFGRQHRALAEETVRAEVAVQMRYVGRATLAGVLGALFLVAAYLLAGSHAANERVTAGQLFLVFTAFTAMTAAVTDVVGIFVQLEEHATYLTDYFQLVDISRRPAAKPAVTAVATDNGPPGVEFRDVWYAYPGHPPALRGLSFTVAPGEFVAMMGRNGAGKSTVVKLMLGLLQPDCGTVLVGGRDLSGLDDDEIRAQAGALFQEYGRYEFTVAEAVRLGRIDKPLDADRMWAALERAQLRALVDSLPDRADNPVGGQFPGSRDLSGGQWQRLALARVLYRDAPLWVLDEPTAALDVAAEVAFLRHLRRSRHRRTLLIVTHRLDTARDADRILLLRDGTLLEDGTHAKLLERGGEYAHYHAELRPST
jgi:ABC-type multidrug transport system fused ATPase/permease subunit